MPSRTRPVRTPLHRHLVEDEAFYVLEGTGQSRCGEQVLDAGPCDVVLLCCRWGGRTPSSSARTRCAPCSHHASGFEDLLADVGEQARERRLPPPAAADPVALGHAAHRHGTEILELPPR
ncbi:hypothetical protein [Pseudonocardia sp. NPDC046786]|uniref:hypothetical protein n=1 Tax=Pseudonocardia sp. NPDC046786 TaxID=3155471 RepID=UPI003400DD34